MMRQHTLFAEPPSVAPPLAAPANAALPEVTLLHGDCLEVMPTLATGSVAMVFCDLPYRTKKHHHTEHHWDKPFDLPRLWFEINRLCETSAAKIFTAVQPFTTVLISSNLCDYNDCLVWDKNVSGTFTTAKFRPLRVHEDVIVFRKTRGTYNPQMVLRDKPFSFINNKVVTHALRQSKMFGVRQTSTHRYPISIIKAPSRAGKERGLHPTQKPTALLEWLIKTYTNPGDLVLDPTAGSGTTAIAALYTGRRCICIEKDAAYYDIGCRRVEEHKAKLLVQT